MSYAIYLRKSRADIEAEAHGEGETLTRHKTTLISLARQKSLEIGAIYEELVSGETIAARPQMQRLLAEVEGGRWEGVLVMEVERLARGDSIDQGIVVQAFKYSGTVIITPAKVYNPQNEFDEEYFEFGLFMSRREYQTIKRRLVAGRIASVKEGKYMGKTDPFGYFRVRVTDGKGYTLKQNPEQAEVVKEIFRLRTEGLGGYQIARHLNALGKRTNAGIAWSTQSVINVLRNPLYAGFVTWGRKPTMPTVRNGAIQKPRKYTEEYTKVRGLHEPLVSEDMFNQVQKLLADTPSIPLKRNHEQKNPFAGLLYCSKCGHSMRLGYTKRRANSLGRLYCKWPDCDCVSAYCEDVEEALMHSLRLWMAEYDVNVEHSNTVSLEQERRFLQKRSEVHQLTEDLKLQQQQLEKASELVEQGVYTPEHFVTRQTQLNARIDEIKQALRKAKQTLQQAEQERNASKTILPKLQHVVTAYPDSTPQEKNDLLKTIVSRISYSKNAYNRANAGDATINLTLTRKFDSHT